MSLYTGKEVHRDDKVKLPIEDEVFKRVEELVRIKNSPSLTYIHFFSGHQEYPSYNT